MKSQLSISLFLVLLFLSCREQNQKDKSRNVAKTNTQSHLTADKEKTAEAGFNYDGISYNFQDQAIKKVISRPTPIEGEKGKPEMINAASFDMNKGKPNAENADATDIGLHIFSNLPDTIVVGDLMTKAFTLYLPLKLELRFDKNLSLRITEVKNITESQCLVSGTFSGTYVPNKQLIKDAEGWESFSKEGSVYQKYKKQRNEIRQSNHTITNGYFRNVRLEHPIKKQQMQDFIKSADKKQ